MRKFIISIILLVIVLSACTPNNGPTQPTPSEPTQPPPPSPVPTVCRNATVGQTVTCRIAHAYCDYRPDVNGKPTFCNDAPYPGHEFTLLVWGQDWSDYDGKCLIVTGFVSRYKGKLQIEASSRSQTEFCH